MSLSDLVISSGDKFKKSGGTAAPLVDIVTFVEAKWGLNTKLFPVQRVILKAHYGVKLNDTDKTVRVTDFRHRNPVMMTEAEYLAYLYDNKRCNIREVIPGVERRELILSIGRRSGKTFISSCIAAYEVYKLIYKECPQKYYGLPLGNNISIFSIATDKDQASLLYNEASSHFNNCAQFKPYTANSTTQYSRFQTPYDIVKHGRYSENKAAKATITIKFKPCVAKGLRGAGNIVVVLDELAHFNDSGESDAENVYKSVKPSMAAFSPKNHNKEAIGPVEARMVIISSPLGRKGFFFKHFQFAMSGVPGTENMLAIQAPTWEVNPTVEVSFLEEAYAQDASSFFTEFGAQFLDSTCAWLENKNDLLACVDPKLRPITRGVFKQPYFMGVDLALAGDYSAIAIGHVEANERIVVDLVDRIGAGEGIYKHLERLEFDDVADWVYAYTKQFQIVNGIFDQWAGLPFEQALHKRGLKQFETHQFTKRLKSDIYKNLKDLMYAKKLVLYDFPVEMVNNEVSVHCDYIEELFALQATYTSEYIVEVAAPRAAGRHDDMSDALVRMLWLATQNAKDTRYISKGSSTSSPDSTTEQLIRNALLAARQQSILKGSHPQRQIYSHVGRRRR